MTHYLKPLWTLVVILTTLATALISYQLFPYIHPVKTDSFLTAYFISSISLFVYGLDAWIINPVGERQFEDFAFQLHKVHGDILFLLGVLALLYFSNIL